ncbi:MAG: hypothetical protein M9951_03440 [Burkholderiaceae bacterium]|nr:hypothetical protein [Burkholderiaceae bacterium]
MKASFTIDSFSLPGANVWIPAAGNASRLEGDGMEAHLTGRSGGHVLGFYPVSTSADLHSDLWEMHPGGDEILLMFSGALTVEYSDGIDHGSACLDAGRGLVIPAGLWHRLVLREPGLLSALTPRQGTRMSGIPG